MSTDTAQFYDRLLNDKAFAKKFRGSVRRLLNQWRAKEAKRAEAKGMTLQEMEREQHAQSFRELERESHENVIRGWFQTVATTSADGVLTSVPDDGTTALGAHPESSPDNPF